MTTAHHELWSVFDARRVKAPELKGLDATVNAAVGYAKNRRPILPRLRAQAARIELLEPKVKDLGSTAFREAVAEHRDLARVGRLVGDHLDLGVALIREGAKRAVGMRPFPVQLMGALAMTNGFIAEMATGEGKTLTAAVAGCPVGLGRPARPRHHRQRLPRRPRRRGDGPGLPPTRADGRPRRPREHAGRAARPLPPQRRLRHEQGTSSPTSCATKFCSATSAATRRPASADCSTRAAAATSSCRCRACSACWSTRPTACSSTRPSRR